MFDLYILYVKIQSDCFFIKKNNNNSTLREKLFKLVKKQENQTISEIKKNKKNYC